LRNAFLNNFINFKKVLGPNIVCMNHLILILLLTTFGFSQKDIRLDNASFEGERQDATVPTGWQPCAEGTTPDILPGFWGVKLDPFEGESYMGLITRDDGTFESIGQRLSGPLKTGDCYRFSLALANSKDYAGYNKPIKLVIYGGRTNCSKDQLLISTEYISHQDWKKYTFQFVPEKDLNYIIFEAQYMDGLYFHYKGNILVDDCSVFKLCDRA